MKISPVCAVRSNQSQNKMSTGAVSSGFMNELQAGYSPSFKKFFFNGKQIGLREIDKLSEKELKAFAKTLLNKSDYPLLTIARECNVYPDSVILGHVRKTNNKPEDIATYKRIMGAVENMKNYKTGLVRKLEELELNPGLNSKKIGAIEVKLRDFERVGEDGFIDPNESLVTAC